MDDANKRERDASKQTSPKIKAEDNPWYLLATLYGVPKEVDQELQAKNRAAWTRYFAADLDEETRTKLIEEKRHLAEELTPFSPEELEEVKRAFAERSKTSAKKLSLPTSDANIDFSNVEFEKGPYFSGYLFSRVSLFLSAAFSGGASFGGAAFSELASFDGAAFSDWSIFADAFFSVSSAVASFRGATFSGGASFDGATFPGYALFSGATFSGPASFGGATFPGWASFDGATFSGPAYFGKATLERKIIFTTFGRTTSFTTFGGTTSFVNAEMKGETSFEGAIFKSEPPKFFGAKLHQGTVWRGIKRWPTPKIKDEAGAFIDAYACLKLEMDRLKKHDDELDFFALELQSRRMLLGPWRGLPIWLYGILSNYGRSYARPLYALFVVAAFGTLVLLLSGALAPWQSPGLSVANTFNVFGFRKDFFDAAAIENLPALLKILAALQTIFGTILLFLFGLGIRNKFRMK